MQNVSQAWRREIWCPYCEKITDHRLSLMSAGRVDARESLRSADPPLGRRHVVTCRSCRLLHSWWAR